MHITQKTIPAPAGYENGIYEELALQERKTTPAPEPDNWALIEERKEIVRERYAEYTEEDEREIVIYAN